MKKKTTATGKTTDQDPLQLIAEKDNQLKLLMRALEIEASLERVRAASMAMHSSKELTNVALVLVNELENLSIEQLGSSILEVDETGNYNQYSAHDSLANKKKILNLITGLNLTKLKFGRKLLRLSRSGVRDFSIPLKGQDLHDWIIFTRDNVHKKRGEAMLKAGFDCIYFHFAIYHGISSVVITTLSPLPKDEGQILRRMADTFAMSYRRFLDLQKAEAQAREAQIETALERVRSRSMAMHKSDELYEVVNEIYAQLQNLGVNFHTAVIHLMLDQSKDLDFWIGTGGDGFYDQLNHWPFVDLPVFHKMHELWGTDEMLNVYFDKKYKDKFISELYKVVAVPKERKAIIESSNEMVMTTAFQKVTAIQLFKYSKGQFDVEEQEIVKRFSKVFEQSYTRFLDLQKAESQAREAQIEAALERIRARTMAMQKTDELLEAAGLLYKELFNLGIASLTSGYVLMDEDEKIGWNYDSSPEDGSIMPEPLGIPHNETKEMRAITASWKKREPFHVIELDPQETIDHQTFIAERTPNFPYTAKELITFSPERLVLHSFNFKEGYLLMINGEKLSTNHIEMMIRFTKAFEQTHTRFLDLQKAEAQAREAEIQLALERVRAASMAMHESGDLLEVARIIFQQLEELGVPAHAAYIYENLTDREAVHCWVAANGQLYPEQIHFPYLKNRIFTETFKALDNSTDFITGQLSKQEKDQLFKHNFKNANLIVPKERQNFIFASEGLTWSTAFLKNTALTAHSYTKIPFSEEQNNIIKRLGAAFEQAYTRFLDLQKAEAQTREAQIEAALERVRAASMAMHQSEELRNVALTLLNEIEHLAIPLLGAAISLVNQDEETQIVYLADHSGQDEKKSLMTTDRHSIKEFWVTEESVKQIRKGEKEMSFVAEGEKLEQWIKWVQKYQSKARANRIRKAKLKRAYINVIIFYDYSAIAVSSLLPFTEEHWSIVRKLSKTFGMSYTRFLDLKKAEAQAREAQIEASMERVRAASMAMHKSEELPNVALIMLNEIERLAVPLIGAGVSIVNEENDTHKMSFADNSAKGNKKTLLITGDIPLGVFWVTREHMKLHDLGHTENSFEMKGKKLAEWIAWVRKYMSKERADRLQAADLSKVYVYNIAFYSRSAISVSSLQVFSEEHWSILRRMAKTFAMSYTRFLDLQKAEAQAREAQIEAALERVRASSMAMHQSQELNNVLSTMFSELTNLDFALARCVIWIYNEADKSVTWYSANPEGEVESYLLPYTDYKVVADYWVFWKKRIRRKYYDLSGDLKKGMDDYVFNHTEMANMPKKVISGMSEPEQVHLYNTFNDFGALFVSSVDSQDEEIYEILERFGNVFNQAYTRFKDIEKAEAQAREAQIEAALERVRARSMAMHKSEELAETDAVLFQQLNDLGVKPERINIGIVKEDERIIEWWSTEQGGKQIDQVFKGSIDEPTTLSKVYKGWKSGKKSLVIEQSGKQLKAWLQYMTEELGLPFNEELRHDRRYQSVAIFSQGMILLTTPEPLSEETFSLLPRFAKVFEQTYTRFLDLQKAEAQARESQIEAALERVRAASMAMHESKELPMVAELMINQITELGLEDIGFAITIQGQAKNTYKLYSADPVQGESKRVLAITPELELESSNMGKMVLERMGKEKSDFTIEGGIELVEEMISFREQYTAQSTASALKDLDIDKVYIHFCRFHGNSNILINTVERLTEEFQLISRRFADVFGQSYTRFLDLQKAEAQAREAQIEAALERIRSRSMAMQSSEELMEVVKVMYDQVEKLGIAKWGCMLLIFDKAKQNVQGWFSEIVKAEYTKPFDFDNKDHEVIRRWWNFWESEEEIMSIYLKDDEKHDFTRYLFTKTGMKVIPDEVKKVIMNEPKVYFKFVNMGCGIIEFVDIVPFPQESIPVLKRIASAFEQAYIRFLDIEKAEAQARESQIEAALERVRAKTMAMHNSRDVADTIVTLFDEVSKLGLDKDIRCGIGILEGSERMETWSATSDPNGEVDLKMGMLDMTIHPLVKRIKQAWKNGTSHYNDQMSGKSLIKYYTALNNEPDYSFHRNLETLPKQEFHNSFSFSEGILFSFSPNRMSEEAALVLKRFARVFGQTYKRYVDLKKAELQARESIKQASIDRVRGEIASMRTTSDLERITPLIWKELTIQGIPFIRCGVFIMEEDKEIIHNYLSSPDGKAIAAFHLPYATPGVVANILKNWRERKEFLDHWDEAAMKEFADMLVKQGIFKSPDQYLKSLPKQGFYLHFLPFNQGMLYVGNTTQLKADEVQLIQSLANAFSTAYARYEDFNKLEAAKRQVDQSFADLKKAQQQLVQSEKMASLGELTAGIAHEIQNPLNFVNNFSELNRELISDLKEEVENGDIEEVKAIAEDIAGNEEKINHHGQRASGIVKGMLEHSRTSDGKKELTDINKLADEYLRLAYHGLRAKDKSFNADFKLDLDDQLSKVNVISQDIGRVLLNIINNAFYACAERNKKKPAADNTYKPEVIVRTKRKNKNVEIVIQDNGSGISQKNIDKIFQPFFTTKPTGQGTGLGLSLSYDIITKGHDGHLEVESDEGIGTRFIIRLPLVRITDKKD